MTHETEQQHNTEHTQSASSEHAHAERARGIQAMMLPVSIVLAGLFLGGGILGAAFISGGQGNNNSDNGQVDATEELVALAGEVGANEGDISSCISDGSNAERVQNDSAEVSDQGTPYNVLMRGDTRVAFAGAFPPDMVSSLIDPLAAGDMQALQTAADEINQEAEREMVVINGAENVRPVDESDRIRGVEDPDVYIVEYSDLQCPFCQRFHGSMMSVLEQYNDGSSDVELAWVYRHHPLAQIHPHANEMAVAAECVAERQGNDTFWDFVDLVFENQSRFSDAS